MPAERLCCVTEPAAPAGTGSTLDSMLSDITRRVVEALRVWECDVYEYRRESDTLVVTALWSADITARDREWLGTTFALAERPGLDPVIRGGQVVESHIDDAGLHPEEAALMRRWGEHSALAMPLVFQGVVIGAMELTEIRARRSFSTEDVQLLELMAVPAAAALQNARMFRREAEQNRRLQALLSASRAIASTIDLEALLDVITAAAREALDAAECTINTLDPRTGTLTTVAYQGRAAVGGRSRELGASYAIADYPADGATLRSGRIAEERISDPGLDAPSRRWMETTGEKSRLSVPLIHEGDAIGLLVFCETESERHFTEEEREVAAALGQQASVAIRHAQGLLESEQQQRQLKRLHESSRAISSSVELEDVLAIVARTTAEALGAEQCQIQEYHAEADTVRPVAFWQRRQDRPEPDSLHKTFSLQDEPEERELLTGKRVVQQLYSAPDLPVRTRATMEAYGDLSYLNVPLVFSGQPFGMMVLVETESERVWTEEEIEFARALGDQAAVAIEHARLYRRVQDQAITDGLTGLYNHRHFYERLEQEVARARRYHTPVSLLMMDMDDFKAFNDRHGHVAGDAVLRDLAEMLTVELRQKLDVVARYGGEEFAIILPNTPLLSGTTAQNTAHPAGELPDGGPPPPGHNDGAEIVAQRIRARVAGHGFITGDGDSRAKLTVSIGVAAFPHGTDSPEDLVANADAALYKAKRAGKDRVETYG